MLKTRIWMVSLVSLALAIGGCGAVPDVLIDELKTQALTAAEEVVQNTIERVVEDRLGDFLGEAGLLSGFDLAGGLIPDFGTDGDVGTDGDFGTDGEADTDTDQ